MSAFGKHVADSQAAFGRGFEEVHRWLDEFAGTTEYGMRHRKVRHHEAGVREAKALFGPGADEAARQHIVADLKEEGWREGDRFPADTWDYVRMGLF